MRACRWLRGASCSARTIVPGFANVTTKIELLLPILYSDPAYNTQLFDDHSLVGEVVLCNVEAIGDTGGDGLKSSYRIVIENLRVDFHSDGALFTS
jgi:hypothetical protein